MGIKFNNDHEKVVAIAIVSLSTVAIVALITFIASGKNTATFAALIGVAGAAVGGIAGFISHNGTNPTNVNKDLTLVSPGDQHIKSSQTLSFSLKANNPDGYILTYEMVPTILNAKLDPSIGAFSWNTKENDIKTYNITFLVTDGHGNSDSKNINITITP